MTTDLRDFYSTVRGGLGGLGGLGVALGIRESPRTSDGFTVIPSIVDGYGGWALRVLTVHGGLGTLAGMRGDCRWYLVEVR